MQRLLEIILGLEEGFLSREGYRVPEFNPRWPFQEVVGAATWNLALGALALGLVIYVYRREGRSRFARILLGTTRALLLAFVIAMLNRPVLTLVQSRTEPSVLAVVMDDSNSMSVRDAGIGADGQGVSRLQAMLELVSGEDQRLMRDLTQQHIVKLYRFDRDARQMASLSKDTFSPPSAGAAPTTVPASPLEEAFAQFKAEGRSTQVLASLRTVLQELQGQRLAGVVLITDGRDAPAESLADHLPVIQDFGKNLGVEIYPVAVGSDKPPQNLAIESIDVQDAAFARDIVSAKVYVRGMGYPAGHTANVVLKNKANGLPLVRSDNRPATATITLGGDAAQEVEINFKPTEVGTLDIIAEVVRQPGEVDDQDNIFPAQIMVLDARISVLYCEGYPRWDYRYLKNEMIRDSTVDISCLLFSADTGFAQEGDKPITRFPESMTEMLAYDVVIFGDVDPRQFTDAQLQLVSDFVLKKKGGFGMVAGPRWAPYAFRNTPIEPILPVSISREPPDDPANIGAGWRPALTKAGQASTIFRFFEDRAANDKFLREDIQPLFWYCRGISAKPNVGEVYAEHPNDLGPDGKKAPILVLGRFGGRTLFSAIDDSWRWRFYTGESVFDTYWVQQLRYLAREKKLGQRRFTITPMRPAYEVGQQVEVHLRVLDPELLQQLPEQIGVIVYQKEADDREQAVRQANLQRREGEPDLYVASWTADSIGRFALKLPALGPNAVATEVPIVVKVPRVELVDPQVDRAMLSRLISAVRTDPGAGPDHSKLRLSADSAPTVVRDELKKIPSAAMVVPLYTEEPLWNAPLALVLFLVLITLEWAMRKIYGML